MSTISEDDLEANVYDLDRPRKGVALIINNLDLEQEATRNDVARLENLFKNKVNCESSFTHVFSTFEELTLVDKLINQHKLSNK